MEDLRKSILEKDTTLKEFKEIREKQQSDFKLCLYKKEDELVEMKRTYNLQLEQCEKHTKVSKGYEDEINRLKIILKNYMRDIET